MSIWCKCKRRLLWLGARLKNDPLRIEEISGMALGGSYKLIRLTKKIVYEKRRSECRVQVELWKVQVEMVMSL